MSKIEIRCARQSDAAALALAEVECFNTAERADEERIAQRLAAFPRHFLLLFEDGKLAAYIDGAVTKEKDLTDDMFEDAALHDENGGWQMIFGLGVLPPFRGKGYAARLLKEFERLAAGEGRLGLVLTCKPYLVAFYAKYGYADEGVCASSHGGAVWHQMRLTLSAIK